MAAMSKSEIQPLRARELRGRKLIEERLAARVTLDVQTENFPQALLEARAQVRAGNVRRENHVGEFPQRMIGRHRIFVVRVERSARDPFFVQRAQQRSLLNDWPTGRV